MWFARRGGSQNLIGLTERANAFSQLIELKAGRETERENVNSLSSLHDWTSAKLHYSSHLFLCIVIGWETLGDAIIFGFSPRGVQNI